MEVEFPARLSRMFDSAAVWAARTGNWVRVVSANDHIHVENSLHYRDSALDFHSSDLDGLARWLRGLGYRVLWAVEDHYFHVHAELAGG